MWVLSLHWTFLMKIILFHYDVFITLEYKQDLEDRVLGVHLVIFVSDLRKRRECELRCKNSLLCYVMKICLLYIIEGCMNLYVYIVIGMKKNHILIIWGGTFYITILCVNLQNWNKAVRNYVCILFIAWCLCINFNNFWNDSKNTESNYH